MHTVTIELNDELYQKFQSRRVYTKRTLEEELLTSFVLDIPILPFATATKYKAFDEVLEFLANGPSAQQIIQFQLSEEARHRAHDLLWKEREQGLAPTEINELDFYVELGDFLGILRAKAQHNNGLRKATDCSRDK